jgi:hypothetical protein
MYFNLQVFVNRTAKASHWQVTELPSLSGREMFSSRWLQIHKTQLRDWRNRKSAVGKATKLRARRS